MRNGYLSSNKLTFLDISDGGTRRWNIAKLLKNWLANSGTIIDRYTDTSPVSLRCLQTELDVDVILYILYRKPAWTWESSFSFKLSRASTWIYVIFQGHKYSSSDASESSSTTYSESNTASQKIHYCVLLNMLPKLAKTKCAEM